MIETIRAESAEVAEDVLPPTAVNLSEWETDHHFSSPPLIVVIIIIVAVKLDHEILTTRPYILFLDEILIAFSNQILLFQVCPPFTRYVFMIHVECKSCQIGSTIETTQLIKTHRNPINGIPLPPPHLYTTPPPP